MHVNEIGLCLLGKEMRKENTKGVERERKGKRKYLPLCIFGCRKEKINKGNKLFPFFGFFFFFFFKENGMRNNCFLVYTLEYDL